MAESTTSVDLSEFYAEQRGRGSVCTVAQALTKLDPDQAFRLRAALSSDVSHAAISRTVKKWGFDLGQGAVQRHRSSECRCD